MEARISRIEAAIGRLVESQEKGIARGKIRGGRRQEARGRGTTRSEEEDVQVVAPPRGYKPKKKKKARAQSRPSRGYSWEDQIYRAPPREARRDRVTGQWHHFSDTAHYEDSSASSRFDPRAADSSQQEYSDPNDDSESEREPRATLIKRRPPTPSTPTATLPKNPSRETKRHLDRILKTHSLFKRMKLADQYMIAEDWDREQTKETLRTIVEAVGRTAAYHGGPVYKKRRSSNHFGPPPKELPPSPPAKRTKSGRVSKAPARPEMVDNVVIMPKKFWPKPRTDDNVDMVERVDIVETQTVTAEVTTTTGPTDADTTTPDVVPSRPQRLTGRRSTTWLPFGQP